jgi:UvrB/uvrC motif
MNFDISHLLDHWDYQPGQVVVRRFVGKDGQEKIQLRLDLGLLQMNAQGRPDGKKPFGHATLFEFYVTKLEQYRMAHDGEDEGFKLKAEDCGRLQMEAFQYHHRYICLLQLEDFSVALRDTTRNLKVFDFVDEYAENEELAWTIQQFRPQLLMLHTRATASQFLQNEEFAAAITEIESGIERIREFYESSGRHEQATQSPEVQGLQHWLTEVNAKRPLSRREQLERDLHNAVSSEDYEKAAKVRDALKKLKPTE